MKKFGGPGRKQQRCSRRNKNSEGATHTNIHAIHALIVEQSLALMHSCRPWWDTCNDATLVQMIVMNYGMKSLTLCSFTSHRMWKPQTVLSYWKTHLFSPFKLNGRRSYLRSFPAQSYALTPHMHQRIPVQTHHLHCTWRFWERYVISWLLQNSITHN